VICCSGDWPCLSGFCQSPTLGVPPDALVADFFSFGYWSLSARCLAGSWPSFAHIPGYLAYQRASLKMWKNPMTGMLHFEVHPCSMQELLINPLPEGASHQGALYPDGVHIKDLKEVHYDDCASSFSLSYSVPTVFLLIPMFTLVPMMS
jgi:hypothetical protein